MATFDTGLPWVLFELNGQTFAVNSMHVKELITIPHVVGLPYAPDSVRGVISLRGQVVTLFDTRVRMGMKSLARETSELIHLLNEREQDHKNWLAELEASVREGREFRLTTDPHQCAFGRWFDTFETDNPLLRNCLDQFRTPHNAIHAVATEVKALIEKDEREHAFGLITRAGNRELQQMLAIFEETRTVITDAVREIALVVEWGEQLVAISVDSVTTVEGMSESTMQDKPVELSAGDEDCVRQIGRREGHDTLVQMLDIDKLLEPMQGLRPPSAEQVAAALEAA